MQIDSVYMHRYNQPKAELNILPKDIPSPSIVFHKWYYYLVGPILLQSAPNWGHLQPDQTYKQINNLKTYQDILTPRINWKDALFRIYFQSL